MAITEIEDSIAAIIDQDQPDQFIYDFLGVYDFPKATITKLRKGTNNLAKAPGEVYLKNKLYYKQVTGDLMQNFVDLKAKVAALGAQPRYLMVTDFQAVLAEDTKTGDTLDVEFARLPQKFEFFLAWNGIEKADFDKENPADIRAAERFAKLYDVVVKDNPKATRHGLNLFLIRVLFCLFAEDTDIFAKNLFTNRLKQLTKADGSDLDRFISQLFGVLDFEVDQRQADTPSWLADFPYVDGDLFEDPHESLKFTQQSRKLIIEAGEKLEWDQINPDILGSMIQAVASEDSRSHLGMHYTSVPNIMKVIKPLFLDELRQAFEDAKGNEKKLNQLYDRIGKIKFMDPACGSGNFLIITYKELRQLEIDILKELNRMGIATFYVPSVTLDQFYGIEIEDFACDVTRLSLWIADHQMNKQLQAEIENVVRPTLPLQHAGAIVCGNALRLDWDQILPHGKDDEVYLFGNPPYVGATHQTKEHKADLKATFKGLGIKLGDIDYICGWFYKAAVIIDRSQNVNASFVSTNSLNQGRSVGSFWPFIFKLDVEITAAVRSFKWNNNAKNNAQVTVVIVQLGSSKVNHDKFIFDSTTFKKVKNINPYLTEGSNVIVKNRLSGPLFSHLPKMVSGNRANDGGGLFFKNEEVDQLRDKGLIRYFKKLKGSKEFINGSFRWVLWVTTSEQAKVVAQDKTILSHIEISKNHRLSSTDGQANQLAETPWQFRDTKIAEGNAIIIPRVSSKNRIYAPMGIVDSNVVISDSAMAIYDAPLWILGLLESRMHMTWLRAVGGRLKTDYRYSAGLVYNTFPVPELSERRKKEMEDLVWQILDIREEEGGTLAELYGSPLAEKNPKPMNPRLKAAHEELDRVVDRAYRDRPFKDDNERLALLLEMYSQKVKEEQ